MEYSGADLYAISGVYLYNHNISEYTTLEHEARFGVNLS